MAKNITTVTHPDGTVSKRSSVRATYTHAVVVGPKDATKAAADADRRAVEADADADALEAAIAAGQVNISSRGFNRRGAADPDAGYDGEHTYHNFSARLAGTSVDWHCDSKGMCEVPGEYAADGTYVSAKGERVIKPAREVVLNHAGARVLDRRADAAKYREEAAAHRAGTADLGGYGVVRWSSREDLARKAADGEFAGYAERGNSVTVVPVDAK